MGRAAPGRAGRRAEPSDRRRIVGPAQRREPGHPCHGAARQQPGPVREIAGVVVHRSRSLQRARHPALTPPRTRVEETVLDLIDCARSFDEAYDWICRAIGRRRTTAARIRAALDGRPRIRWRHDIELALGYASGGALSVLELRYVRGVERAHGLPIGDTAGSGTAGDRKPVPGQPVRRSTALASRSTGLPRTRKTSSGGISAATGGTRSTKGSTRSGSGCLT